jgi:uncharacterized protein YecE (DUF72 family)
MGLQLAANRLDATINPDTAAIVQWQNAALWQRMSWVRNPLAAPIYPFQPSQPARSFRATRTCLPRAPRVNPTAASVQALSPQNLFAGTSGWAYPTWKPGFYPADLPSRAFLHFYASELTSVEVNYTFRTLPAVEQLQGWLDATPPGFRFSFKAPQRITHFQRLRESANAVAEFTAALKPARKAGKLGPLLFQFPPNFVADNDRLSDFLKLRPLKGYVTAFEFRNISWFTESTYDLLRGHNAALCVAESDELTTPDVATADFRCYRLRRNGGYKPADLKTFATRFTTLARSGEVFVYFKHEDEPTGARNATAMLRYAAELDEASGVSE